MTASFFNLKPGSTLSQVRRGPAPGFYFVRDGERDLSVQLAGGMVHCACGQSTCEHGKAALDYRRMCELVTPKPAEPQPPFPFINVYYAGNRWYIDFYCETGAQAIAHRDTERAAMSFARARAKRMGIPLYTGPVTFPAIQPQPQRPRTEWTEEIDDAPSTGYHPYCENGEHDGCPGCACPCHHETAVTTPTIVLQQPWYTVTVEDRSLKCTCDEFCHDGFCPHVRVAWRNLEPSRAHYVVRGAQ